MDNINQYRDLFFEETDEYLQTLDDSVLELERNPQDRELLDEIFRAAHTLKGMAATMGYKTMTDLTHHMENVFELFRDGSVEVDSNIITLIFKCLDQLRTIVEDLKEDKDIDYDISQLIEELNNISGEGQELTSKEGSKGEYNINISDTDIKVIEDAQARNYKAFKIRVEITKSCMLKGARAYLIIDKLEQQGDIISSNPSPEELEDGNYQDSFSLIYISKLEREKVKDIIEGNAEIENVLIKDLEDLYIEKEDRLDKEDKEKREEKKTGKSSRSQRGQLNQSIRVDLDRLDSFMNLVSELVIYRTRLEDLTTRHNIEEINEPLEHVGRITSELQDLVLKIRMQPVNVVLNRFPRMVRDLSQELDKEIELVIRGEETELDRTVVSELGEPLVHLIRNAADHGIESGEVRESLGKPRKGLINVSAYQEGNRVVLVVQDDGKGLDPKLIKENAERKGIDTEGLGDKELINLIFHQGFSTVEDVTDVSGRGVGMDVVREKISSLGGDIEVSSEVNVGTSFLIKLPLTLSIIQALMVNIGEEVFALPLGIIERVVKLEEDEIVESHNGEVYIHMEKAIPVIRTNERLNIESRNKENHLILISLGEEYYGLVVDSLIGQQEIVIKKLSGALSKMDEYLGATILGNGDIVLILDIANLCNNSKGGIYGS